MSEQPPFPFEDAPRAAPDVPGRQRRPWTLRRWVVLLIILAFFGIVMSEVLDPFGDAPYMEIPHGDHSHYVPRDRDPNVSVDQFPTTPPGPDERILPDGRVVPK